MDTVEETYTGEEVIAVSKQLSSGGIWAEDTGKIEGEWSGEVTTSAPKPGKPTLGRNTVMSDAKRTLDENKIPPDVVNSLKELVGAAVAKKLGLQKDETIRFSLDSMRSMIEKDVRKWIADVAVQVASPKSVDLSEFRQRIDQIEEKLTVIQNLATTRAQEERELLTLALKTVEDAKAGDDDTVSRTSNVARLELRQQELEKQIKFLEEQKLKAQPMSPGRVTVTLDGKQKKKFASTVY